MAKAVLVCYTCEVILNRANYVLKVFVKILLIIQTMRSNSLAIPHSGSSLCIFLPSIIFSDALITSI